MKDETFAAVLGQLGSENDQERATAARLATRELQRRELTWQDVAGLLSSQRRREAVGDTIERAAAAYGRTTDRDAREREKTRYARVAQKVLDRAELRRDEESWISASLEAYVVTQSHWLMLRRIGLRRGIQV